LDELDPVIEFSDISFKYEEKTIFEKLSFTLDQNKKAGVKGANGSGKTTLLQLIVGLLKPSEGLIKLFGNNMSSEEDFKPIRKKTGFLFQDSDNQLFSPTVIDDLCFGLFNLGYSEEDADHIARLTLQELEIEELADKITYKLSGGEKRLAAFASIHVMKPELYLLDEPTAGLDRKTEDRFTELVAGIEQPMLVVSHNKEFMDKIASDIISI
jgi:cobalt/nickel transport system ATP-binding protein